MVYRNNYFSVVALRLPSPETFARCPMFFQRLTSFELAFSLRGEKGETFDNYSFAAVHPMCFIRIFLFKFFIITAFLFEYVSLAGLGISGRKVK